MVYTNYQSQWESSGFFLPLTLGCVSVCSRPFLVPGFCSGQMQHAYCFLALLGISSLRNTLECCWTRPLWHRSCWLGKWWDIANGPQIFAAVAAAARVHCLLILWMFRRLYMPVSRWKSKISRWAVAIEYASSMSWPEVFYLSIPSETSVFVFKTGLIWPVFTFYSVFVISEHLSWRNQKKKIYKNGASLLKARCMLLALQTISLKSQVYLRDYRGDGPEGWGGWCSARGMRLSDGPTAESQKMSVGFFIKQSLLCLNSVSPWMVKFFSLMFTFLLLWADTQEKQLDDRRVWLAIRRDSPSRQGGLVARVEGLFKKQRGECYRPASFPLLNSLWDPSPWIGAAHTQGGITYTQGEAS